MKKRWMSVLLLVVMLLSLFPTTAQAEDDRTYVKAIDLNIELPQAGMTQKEGTEVALLSAKTAHGDLAAKGAVTLFKISWNGEFDKTDRANPKFQAGMTYTATIQIQFVWGEGYVANHEIVNDNYHIDSDLFKVTVNGVTAVTQESSPGFPVVKVNLTVPALELSAEEKAAKEAERQEKFDLRHASLRASAPSITSAEADTIWLEKQAYDTIILNMTTGPAHGNGYEGRYIIDETLNKDYVTSILVDFDFDLMANDYQTEEFIYSLTTEYDNLKEIWLSDQIDVVYFLQKLKQGTEDLGYGRQTWYWTNSGGFNVGDATLYIPSSSVAAVKEAYKEDNGYISPCFSIKVYDGDVYAAQKAGGAAARDYCTKHKYTEVIMANDRIANIDDCSKGLTWYYSCAICGKCEYNDKHTISRYYSYDHAVPATDHDYWLNRATKEAYVGVNAAGDHVFWQSCTYCGKPYNYHQEHLTEKDMINSGITELTFKEWNQRMLDSLAQKESEALTYSTAQYNMFTLSAKSEAKVKKAYQSDVNIALDNNLLDTELLGKDYTKDINRLQIASMAVRLAEELTGKEIAPAPADTFTDTDNLYVRKAYAAGMMEGETATSFNPEGTVSRQQMGTFFYRALMWVQDNSDIRYTDYESKLDFYKDARKLADYAEEPMAFMTALDLIQGKKLKPKGVCSIQLAASVASRCLDAHQVGWYQAKEDVRYQSASEALTTYITLKKGDLVWVTGNRMGSGVMDTYLDKLKGEYSGSYCYFPVVEPLTGEKCYISAGKLKAVRD